MTDITTADVRPTAADDTARRGRWCLAAGLVGIAQGAAVLAWPHQVEDSLYSFPFTSTWYVIAQATFFLQHLPLAAAVAAVAALPALRGQKAARRALVAAAAGLGLLALVELVAMSAAATANDSALATTVSSLYSVPVLLTGTGLAVAGVLLLRRHVLGGGVPGRYVLGRQLSWTVLALGLFVFAGLVPALATNSFVAGRVAIMAWMVLFVLLGRVLQRPARAAVHRELAAGPADHS